MGLFGAGLGLNFMDKLGFADGLFGLHYLRFNLGCLKSSAQNSSGVPVVQAPLVSFNGVVSDFWPLNDCHGHHAAFLWKFHVLLTCLLFWYLLSFSFWTRPKGPWGSYDGWSQMRQKARAALRWTGYEDWVCLKMGPPLTGWSSIFQRNCQ